MWLLSRLSKPRDMENNHVPSVCYDICNNAYLETVAKGKNATLCQPGSAERDYYEGCSVCVERYADNATEYTALDDIFAPLLDFCESVDDATPTIDASWLTMYPAFTPATLVLATDFGGESSSEILYRTASAYSTLPGYFFHLLVSVDSIISSYVPGSIFSQLAHSVSLCAGAASVTGDATSLLYAALEATSLPPWFTAAVPPTYSSQMYTLQEQINQIRATPMSLAPLPMSSAISIESLLQTYTDTGTQRSRAWIAGPVVGAITVISLLALGVFIHQRRRRRRAAARPELEGDTFQETGDKPQLHPDHLPPRQLCEMDASQAPSEADDGALPEMAADEAPARELAAPDHHRSRAFVSGKDATKPETSAEEHRGEAGGFGTLKTPLQQGHQVDRDTGRNLANLLD